MTLDSESKEHLIEWLVKSLESISDAEPQCLSKYVLALVQNDPLESGLKEICITKLEEFLGDETSEFVDRLLTALKEESYLPRNKRKQNPILNHPRHEHHKNNSNNNDDSGNNSNMTKRRRGGSDEYRHGGRRRDDYHHHPHQQQYPYPPQQQYPPRHGDHHRSNNSENKSRDDYHRYPGPYGGPPLDPYGRPIPPHMMMMNPPPHHFPHPRNPNHGGYYGGRHNGGGRPQDQQQSQKKQKNGEESKDIEQGGEKPNKGGADENDRTTLLIDHVDPEYINVSKIAIHFSRFGNVVNIQMLPTVKNALVQFSTYAEALTAFKSPLPVCNNRFIRVKWSKTSPENPKDGRTAEELQNEMVSPEEAKAAALAQGKEVLDQKRKLIEQQKDLKKKKEALVKMQLEQHQLLLEKISNKAGVEAEKETLRVKITSLTQELAQLQGVIPVPVVNAKDLENKPLATTNDNTRGRSGRLSRGRGGRGRGGRGFVNTLDNRTTILKVGNVPDQAQEKSVLEQHYISFGKITQLLFDPQDQKVAYVKFQDRYTAQRAMQHGNFFGETPLTVQWIESEDVPTSSSKAEAASTASSKEEPK